MVALLAVVRQFFSGAFFSGALVFIIPFVGFFLAPTLIRLNENAMAKDDMLGRILRFLNLGRPYNRKSKVIQVRIGALLMMLFGALLTAYNIAFPGTSAH